MASIFLLYIGEKSVTQISDFKECHFKYTDKDISMSFLLHHDALHAQIKI
jgi:hypothetical protein